MIKHTLFIFVTLLFITCKKDTTDTYKPLVVGDYSPINKTHKTWIYNVNELIFNSFTQSVDTQNYQLIEQFDTFFDDNLNRPAARFSRFKRENDSAAWEFVFNYYKIILPDYLETVENNTRFMRLSFPVGLDVIWDENMNNNLSQNILFYSIINEPVTVNSTEYKECLQTETEPIFNNFEQRHSKTVYAKNTGIVHIKQIQKRKIGGFFDGFDRTLDLIEVK